MIASNKFRILIFFFVIVLTTNVNSQPEIVGGSNQDKIKPKKTEVPKTIDMTADRTGTERAFTKNDKVISGEAQINNLDGKVTKGNGATLGPIEGTAGETGAEVTLSTGHTYKIAPGATFKKDESGKIWINGVLQKAQVPSKKSKSAQKATPQKPAPSETSQGSPESPPQESPSDPPPQQPSQQATQPVTFQGAQSASIEPNGNYQIQAAEHVSHGGLTVQNTQAMRFQDGTFTIERADRIEIADGFLTEVRNFVGDEVTFHIGYAKDVINGCINLRNVRDTDFTVSAKQIKIEPLSGVAFNISDCGFGQSEFEAYSADSKIVIPKSKRPQYEVHKGRLKCHSFQATEILETEANASVQYSDRCFSCFTVNPPGNYWYNDRDVKKDFGLHVPDDGEPYRLCLKKQAIDYFVYYDGLVDFVDKQISLTKVIDQLKYPFKGGNIASLLMNNLIEDENNFRLQLKLDDDFLFVKNLFIGGTTLNETVEKKELKTVTSPSNYYKIHEKEVQDEVHRLAKVHFRLDRPSLTQQRIDSYETNYFEPKISFLDNVATQRSELQTLVILTPNHESIGEIVN